MGTGQTGARKMLTRVMTGSALPLPVQALGTEGQSPHDGEGVKRWQPAFPDPAFPSSPRPPSLVGGDLPPLTPCLNMQPKQRIKTTD